MAKSKGKTALKRTGRALKSAARGILASGAEILGAGAMALNPTAKISRWKTLEKKEQLILKQLYRLVERDYHKATTSQQRRALLEKKWGFENRLKDIAKEKQKLFEKGQTNPTRRLKVRNKYIDLVIKGQAKKTPDGWRVGKKTFAQGRGTVNVSSGYYLDKATGLVYAKRERNRTKKRTKKKAGKRNASRAVHSARKAKTGRARAVGKTGRKSIRARSKKNRMVKRKASQTARAKSRVQTRKATAKRITRNPSPESIRKIFAGSVSGSRDLFFPKGTPTGLAKLGKLVSITTEEGTIKPVSGTAWLCADTNEKLHIGSTSNAPLFGGPARSFGKVTKVEYESSKPHLGYKGPIIWFHHMGERGGTRPTLHADGKGGLKFRGGRYRLTRRGIEN